MPPKNPQGFHSNVAPIYIDVPPNAPCSKEPDCHVDPHGIPYHSLNCNRAKLLLKAIQEATN